MKVSTENGCPTAPQRWLRGSVWVLGLAPLVFLAWYALGGQVAAPYLDQWALVDFFHRVATGQVGLADLFARHVGRVHHIAFPRLILTPLAFATGWALEAEIVLNLLTAALTAALLVSIAARRIPRDGWHIVAAANVATSFAVFSLGQMLNWLWGFAFVLFLGNLLMVAGVWLLQPGRRGARGPRVAAAACCCVAASFTQTQGLLTWVALVPCLLWLGLPRHRLLRVLAVWSGLAVVTALLFAWGYDPASDRLGPKLDMLLDKPMTSLGYILRLLGGPIGFLVLALGAEDFRPFAPIGALVVLAFVVCGWIVFGRGDAEARAQSLPWLSLGLYTLLYSVLNTIGRVKGAIGGVFVLSASAYVTHALPLTIAVIQLGAMALAGPDGARPGVRWQRRVGAVVFGSVAASLVLLSVVGIPGALAFRSGYTNTAPCFDLYHYMEARGSCGAMQSHAEEVRKLEEIGFRRTRRDLVFAASDAPVAGAIEGSEIFTSRRGTRGVRVNGRLDAPAPWQTVVVGFGGEARFLAHTRADGDGRWSLRVAPHLLQDRTAPIRAWAYDRAGGRFVPLSGELELP